MLILITTLSSMAAKSLGFKCSCVAMLFLVGLTIVYASDPGLLQDFCIGVIDPHTALFVNGLFCKDPMKVTDEDFVYRGFNTPGDTTNLIGSRVTMVNQTNLPALNTLGVSVARVDFAPGGVNPPHLHPRGSEIFTVIEGALYAGLVTANQIDGTNRLFSTVLKKGDIFVFPQGLVHFQINVGRTPAVANVAFGSQNPGVVTVANAVFGSTPEIPVDVLSRAFHVEDSVIKYIQSKFD